MIKHVLYSVFILNILISSIATAQEKKITPGSPEAASLAKFINVPVDYSTGIPNISIPLYDLKSGDISVPITLSYHAGGIRVNEKSTWVGLGWNLSAEPEITRSVNGRPDEEPSKGHFTQLYPTSGTTGQKDYRIRMASGEYDLDPDEFYYKLIGKSGKFYFHTEKDSITKPIIFPYENIKIKMFDSLETVARITDDDGTYYFFDDVTERTLEPKVSSFNAITSWKCTSMISPTKKDTISFSYSANYTKSQLSFFEKVDIYDSLSTNIGLLENFEGMNFNAVNPKFDYNESYPYIYGTPRIYNHNSDGINNRMHYFNDLTASMPTISRNPLDIGLSAGSIQYNEMNKVTEIKSRTGRVEFHQRSNLNYLDSITVYNQDNKRLKTIRFFYHSEDGTTDNMIMLDSIHIKGTDQKKVERYAFDYDSSHGLFFGMKRADPWGFNLGNATTNNIEFVTSSVPYQWVSIVPDARIDFKRTMPLGTSNPRPDSTANQAFILKSMHYPTGGRADFIFETNKYISIPPFGNGEISPAGGLRIKRIEYFNDLDSEKPVMVKQYKYGTNENGVGFTRSYSNLANYYYEQKIHYVNPTVKNVFYYYGQYGNGEIRERKRTYVSQPLNVMSFAGGTPVVYGMVTEYQIDAGKLSGKTVYKYNYSPGVTNIFREGWTSMTKLAPEWHLGQLLSETQYAFADNKYTWVNKKENKFITPEFGSVRIMKAFQTDIVSAGDADNPYAIDYAEVAVLDYYLMTGTSQPSMETTFSRSLSDTTSIFKSVKNYYYDSPYPTPGYLYPTRTSYEDGKGNLKLEYTTYPHSYSSADTLMTKLRNRNMLNYPIEKVSAFRRAGTTDTLITGGSLNNFYSTGFMRNQKALELAKPVALSTFKFSCAPTGKVPVWGNIGKSLFVPSSAYKLKVTYDKYDERGNIVQLTTDSLVRTSYIWDYKKAYPIAEIKNASIEQVAFSSFESKDKGSWEYDYQNGPSSTYKRTGNKSYRLAERSISKTGLNSATIYILSYWTRNTIAYTITGTVGSAILNKTVEGWNYYTHKITGRTSITIPSSGGGYIDDLRLCPEDALMSTFTYDPAVGVTSMTDAASESVYYLYDPFSRLQYIRDQKGNLIKKFQYHYHFE
ncbi:MAG: hypothetical protein EOO04_19055 [Chitinophagaceae bacterium]|nr:MAG: hypothetical protein EOO04_19055 [Chitinophagaceae bacterium]